MQERPTYQDYHQHSPYFKPASARALDKVKQYMLKRRGPMIDPWGTPKEIGIESEKALPILTYWVRPVRMALSHKIEQPVVLNFNCSMVSSALWSRVSKAVDRSIISKTTASVWSTVTRYHLPVSGGKSHTHDDVYSHTVMQHASC